MTKKEILEFLELPESVPDEDIAIRLASKLVYFERLNENAPNEFLKKLHLQNIEKIKFIQNQYNFKEPQARQATPQQIYTEKNNEPLGWLIRHTENQPGKKFQLQKGSNPIGRGAELQKINGINIDDDDYVSRRHAVLYVETSTSGTRFFIEDSPEANGEKSSKNGTYINGREQRIQKKVTLAAEDTIQIGLTKLILKLPKANIHTLMSEVEESSYMKTVVINIF